MKTLDIRRPEDATLFIVFSAATIWAAATEWIATPLELPRAALLAVLFLAIRLLFMKNIPSPTGSGAIVMAVGIFINGAIVRFTIFNQEIIRSLGVILFILSLFIAGSYVSDAMQKRFFRKHFAHPIASFATGTWVAGISVCCIALSQRLPDWKSVVQVLVIGNIGLWLYFVYRAVRNFFQLFGTESGQKVHGVLLLSTVSTQSLVIVWKAAFGESAGYRLVAPWVIALGVIFYFVSFYLIARRYAGKGVHVDLDRDWFNTNCILHGAMSITGLASAVCGVISANVILLIWLWVIAWFIIVEGVEIVRGVKRINLHGFADGLLVYDPTQWSRNFTFGMLYAFTLNFDLSKSAATGSFLSPFRDAVLRYFAWVVLLLLLIEILIFFRDRLSLDRPGTP